MPYKDPDVARQKTAERLRRLRAQPGYSAAKNRVWRAKNPEKYRAHKAVENALVRGALVEGPCERCGALKVEAHHDDYSQPLAVAWLCRNHHLARHRELKAALVCSSVAPESAAACRAH